MTSINEPSVAVFVGIGKYVAPLKWGERTELISKLIRLKDDMDKAERIAGRIRGDGALADEGDVAELAELVKDIAWETDLIDSANELIDEYDNVDTAFTDWENEVDARLTPEEHEELEHEKLVYKLKTV